VLNKVQSNTGHGEYLADIGGRFLASRHGQFCGAISDMAPAIDNIG
jgi:hypothetical protein